MQEIAFPCFKFQKCSGGVHPQTPPIHAWYIGHTRGLQPLLSPSNILSHRKVPFQKMPPPPGKSLKKALQSTRHEQGGISFSTNQRFCLHFCPKPIRMRKTLHHMKFVNKRMGYFRAFLQMVFLVFAMKLIYVVLKRILLNFLVAIFD